MDVLEKILLELQAMQSRLEILIVYKTGKSNASIDFFADGKPEHTNDLVLAYEKITKVVLALQDDLKYYLAAKYRDIKISEPLPKKDTKLSASSSGLFSVSTSIKPEPSYNCSDLLNNQR